MLECKTRDAAPHGNARAEEIEIIRNPRPLFLVNSVGMEVARWLADVGGAAVDRGRPASAGDGSALICPRMSALFGSGISPHADRLPTCRRSECIDRCFRSVRGGRLSGTACWRWLSSTSSIAFTRTHRCTPSKHWPPRRATAVAIRQVSEFLSPTSASRTAGRTAGLHRSCAGLRAQIQIFCCCWRRMPGGSVSSSRYEGATRTRSLSRRTMDTGYTCYPACPRSNRGFVFCWRTTCPRSRQLIVGRQVRSESRPAIVAGDLNDIACSNTTQLFQRDQRLARSAHRSRSLQHL